MKCERCGINLDPRSPLEGHYVWCDVVPIESREAHYRRRGDLLQEIIGHLDAYAFEPSQWNNIRGRIVAELGGPEYALRGGR